MPRAAIRLAAVAALLAAGPSAAAPARTEGHRYDAFAPAAAPRVARRASGSCWTASISSARHDAFRCRAGNVVYDPCFARASSARTVRCPLAAPGSAVLQLRLAGGLPRAHTATDAMRLDPWAVRTARGKWCLLITGATTDIGEQPIRYRCLGGGVLVGDPDRVAPRWLIFEARGELSRDDHPVALTDVWW